MRQIYLLIALTFGFSIYAQEGSVIKGSNSNTTLEVNATQIRADGGEWVTLPTGGGGGTDDQNASEVPFDDTGLSITASNVQELGEALDAKVVGSGSGDVSKVGTPVDGQIGIWTGDGTIEGESNLTFDGSNLTLHSSSNSVTIQSEDAFVFKTGNGSGGYNTIFAFDMGSNPEMNLIRNLKMNSKRIYGLPTPSGNDDAATKGYVDSRTTKNTVGTTAERPASPSAGDSHFDTTLGYRVDFDGTNWVDGTGTTR